LFALADQKIAVTAQKKPNAEYKYNPLGDQVKSESQQ
jgi:hypothetical protein